MGAVFGVNVELIVAALVAAIAPIWAVVESRRARHESSQVRADIATNHGQRPGEYLELIAYTLNETRQDLDAHREEFRQHRDETRTHILEDNRRFAVIEERLGISEEEQ